MPDWFYCIHKSGSFYNLKSNDLDLWKSGVKIVAFIHRQNGPVWVGNKGQAVAWKNELNANK